jgi:presenilin-like A22 family membrane protease
VTTTEETAPADDAADTDDGVRDAFFIGLGDAVIPTVLVASAAFFLPSSLTPSLGVPGLPALTLPALTAMVGTFAGLFTLLWMVLKGRPHAGLPLLNGGAIGGYLLGALASGVPLLTALGF